MSQILKGIQDLLPALPPNPPLPRAIARVVKARSKGVVLYYDFEGHILLPPPFQSKVIDKSGHGNNGVLKNDAHIKNGRLVLDGVDDYVHVPDSIPVKKSITVLVRARSDTPTWNAYGWIASSLVANGFLIHPWLDEKRVTMYVYDEEGDRHKIGEVTPSDITRDHLYGLVYNEVTGKAYTVLDEKVAGYSLDITRAPDTIPAEIGRYYSAESGKRFGKGSIEEVCIYNQALSEEEIPK